MKQTLLEIMSAMMPYMMPLVWAGGIAVALALLLMALRLTRAARRSATLAVALGLFFLACQGLGAALGAQPSINLGDPRQLEFMLVPFWQVGLSLLGPGVAIWALSRSRLLTAA